MSKFFISLILVSLFTFSLFSQDPGVAEKRKELTSRVINSLQAGKLDEAIESGEKLVKLEESAKSADTVSLTNSLLNLARMKRDVFRVLRERLMKRTIDAGERVNASVKAYENAKESDSLYRRALELNEQGGRGETEQTADIKSELAWIIYNRNVSKVSIDAAEKFFLESIELSEKIRGVGAEKTLINILMTGSFYDEFDNYEKALSYYERFIQNVERSRGKDSPALVNALRPLARILFNTFQEKEANEIVSRIEKLTGKPETLQTTALELHGRSKDAVALSMKLSSERQLEMRYFLAMLKASTRTISPYNYSQVSQMKRIAVRVVADEEGKIIEAIADDKIKDEKLAKRAEETVSQWTVRPFNYNGTKRRLRGVLFYFELD